MLPDQNLGKVDVNILNFFNAIILNFKLNHILILFLVLFSKHFYKELATCF